MLAELRLLLDFVPPPSPMEDYAAAVIDSNCLSKRTASTRRLTYQRLRELYALDRWTPVFRVLRRLWAVDEHGRPLLALLAAMARDPLLAATYPAILGQPVGAEFQRVPVANALRDAVDQRLNDSILAKVVRNISSTWTQSGHLSGRTLKYRTGAKATPATAAYAVFLANSAGFHGAEILSSGWFQVLDCPAHVARHLTLEAKRLGLLDVRMAGDVVEFNLARLER